MKFSTAIKQRYSKVNPLETDAAKLSKQIFEYLKDQLVSKEYREGEFFIFKTFSGDDLLVWVKIKRYIKSPKKNQFVILTTGEFDESGELTVTAKLFGKIPENIEQYFESFIFDLKNTVRHELEHYYQTELAGETKRKRTWDEVEKLYESEDSGDKLAEYRSYYLSNSEIEAYVSGAYYEAKKSKKGFYEVLYDELEQIQSDLENIEGGPELFKEIHDTWIDYARQRFPEAQGI